MSKHFNEAVEGDDGGLVICRGCKASGTYADLPSGECPTPYKPDSVLLKESLAREQALQQRLTAADERADVLSPGSALGDVHLERLRQIDVENRSPVDDDDYSLGQLAYAAAGYAQGSVPAQQVQGCLRPSYWPCIPGGGSPAPHAECW